MLDRIVIECVNQRAVQRRTTDFVNHPIAFENALAHGPADRIIQIFYRFG